MLKRVGSVLVILLLLWSVGITAYGAPSAPADNGSTSDKKEDEEKPDNKPKTGKYKIINDGTARDDPYGDSKLPISFKDTKYYDCFIPYKLTADDVGGWCNKITGTPYYKPMPDDVRTTRKIGWMATWEGDCKWFSGHGAQPQGLDWGYEEDTGLRLLTDKNGTQYYVCAIQSFQYHNDTAGKDGFPGWGSNVGSCFEVILTDGTVIRFMVGDNNGDPHTNGGVGDTNDGANTPCGADGRWYFEKIKMKQYQNLFTGSATSHLELWGGSADCVNAFLNKYNFGNDDDKNKIAFYRMYDFNLHEPREPVSEEVKKVTYKIGVDGIESDSSGEEVVDLAPQAGMFEETHFVKWKVMPTTTVHTGVRMIDSWGEMHEDEVYNIESWTSSLEKENKDSFLVRGGRTVSLFMGIVFEVWMMFIYLAYWFDRINNFFDFPLLPICTFGRLRISADETECTFRVTSLAKGEMRTINHKHLLGVVITGLAFGSLIISGVMFTWLHSFINMVLEFLR
ncbi:MAG: hypothetical protein K2P14_06570 [Anaeroplasmataceae bacterium]|nr:hypothetical protein [Anaeroplasmataceae bacterium]